MRNSNTEITTDDDDDESATISDEDVTTTETDSEVESENDAVESVHQFPFCQGEKVLAYHRRLIYEAKVLF